MSIFDIFTFKKEVGKVFSKENFKTILLLIRSRIVELVKINVPGPDKKEHLDNVIAARIDGIVLEKDISNKIVLWLVDRLKEIMPTVTQIQYDFLKEKIENL